MRRQLTLALLAACFGGAYAQAPAQGPQAPSAEVRKFITVDQPLVALTGVRVIDGTGGPVQENRPTPRRHGPSPRSARTRSVVERPMISGRNSTRPP